MPNDSEQRTGRGHVKLRTSCDACGAAKLRCDRGQPACGRCALHNAACVYGLSRKMGKPPRQKLRHASVRAAAGEPNASSRESWYPTPRHANTDMITDLNPNTNTNTDPNTGTDLNTSTADPSSAFTLTLDAFTAPPQPLPALSAFDYGDWSNLNHLYGDLLAPEPSPHTTDPPLSNAAAEHNCARKTCDMLGSLTFFPLDASPASASPDSASTANEIPLDHVLRITRKATDQLATLLRCPCVASPNLALLHASIISRIFAWYHDATMSIHSASMRTDASATSLPCNLPRTTRSSSVSRTVSTAASSLVCPSTATTSISSANIAIGTYSVDDQRVEAAVEIQLLLGEMRRAGTLIAHSLLEASGTHHPDHEPAHGSEESLLQNLHAWLTSEHARIINVIKSKLRDLNS